MIGLIMIRTGERNYERQFKDQNRCKNTFDRYRTS